MAAAPRATFTTIHAEGALLPPDLLRRVADGDADLGGLSPADYGYPGERLNEVINRKWNVLLGTWAAFKSALAGLPQGDPGTTVTRERWLLPLFRELDYGRLATARAVEIDGKSYPVSHRSPDRRVPLHLVGCGVKLDERTRGVAGAAAASPHSLAQTFLNRSEAHLWGFVSNGLRLRLLRDNASLTRQAFVEFDLEAMMGGEVYADFVLLFLLCHQSRVAAERPADFWLERWARAAQQQGRRALDGMRARVEAAIVALGNGFLAHPKNGALREELQSGAIKKEDYYRQLLRLVYRLLFLFVAEDRELLLDPKADEAARQRYIDYYSTARLRRLAGRMRGSRHSDLFHALRLVMALLGSENDGRGAGLGLPVLGSFLFSAGAVPDLTGCDLSNADLLAAVRALAFVEDPAVRMLRPVDYKNLGPEELGSVYESLLELHPEVNTGARTFALATAGGHERKTTGSYYTPSELIDALLDSALNPVLGEALTALDPAAAILRLKVCDPACGSGHFLIAAANRMAKALASVRTGEEEPPPGAIQPAKRDVIGHCIYGVDLNPMAVELCKVNLWMEALEPGKPLAFLDHRIQCGNSLLGTTPRLVAEGIPDDAFNPIEGDDRKLAGALRRRNREERKQRGPEAGMQLGLFEAPAADHRALAAGMHAVDTIADDTPAGVRRKEARWRALAGAPETVRTRLLADAWCAAFVWEKNPGLTFPVTFPMSFSASPMPMTDLTYRHLSRDPLRAAFALVREVVAALAEQYRFFHWHLAFPDVFTVPDNLADAENPQAGWNGCFDVVLGNPPWERIKIQEKEWFAGRDDEITAAPNAAARRRMIEALEDKNPHLLAAFQADKRQAEGESHFVRASGRYPLCGRGDVNTYTIFAELDRHVVSGAGRVGVIVPSGIATDHTTRFFFQDLLESRSLRSLYEFENEGFFGAGQGHMVRFALMTIGGPQQPSGQTDFMFQGKSLNDLEVTENHFTLSAEDIALINPNSQTCPIFQTKRGAEITKRVYRHVPVLIREDNPDVNPWGISFLRMFDMANDSERFRTFDELISEGWQLRGNVFLKDQARYLPLYEAKMVYKLDHRHGDFSDGGGQRLHILPAISERRLKNPDYHVRPFYWVSESDVHERLTGWPFGWLFGWRDVTDARASARTVISSVIPRVGVNDKYLLMMPAVEMTYSTALFANLDSLPLDYCARQKIGGISLKYFTMKQLAVIPPHTYTPDLLAFITPRVLELSYTAWDLQPFAQDVGSDGPPFIWDEVRRFLMRCELDALYFHLYQIAREDVDYIMETFPIVKRKDELAHGEYRTKRVILEMYDQMAALPKMAVPAPKGEGEYLVPDVSQWQTWLSPPPADPRAAHPPKD